MALGILYAAIDLSIDVSPYQFPRTTKSSSFLPDRAYRILYILLQAYIHSVSAITVCNYLDHLDLLKLILWSTALMMSCCF